MITLCRVHQLTLINFYNRNTLIKASKPYSTLLDQSILCIFRRLFCIMVSGAGSSFPRITGFAFRFQTKLCPGCGCGRRRPNDRLWGCDPGPWRPMSFGDWNLSKHIIASRVPSNDTPPSAHSERCLLEPYKIGQIDLNIASELEFFARF